MKHADRVTIMAGETVVSYGAPSKSESECAHAWERDALHTLGNGTFYATETVDIRDHGMVDVCRRCMSIRTARAS